MNAHTQKYFLLFIFLLLTPPTLAMKHITAAVASMLNKHRAHDIDNEEDADNAVAKAQTPEALLGQQLVRALRKNDVITAQSLVEQKADVTAAPARSPGNEWYAIYFHEQTKRVDSHTSFDGHHLPPLWLAMVCTHPNTPALVQQLIESKADIHAPYVWEKGSCLDLLRSRTLDKKFDDAQTEELIRILVFASLDSYSPRKNEDLGIYEKFDPMMAKALQERDATHASAQHEDASAAQQSAEQKAE